MRSTYKPELTAELLREHISYSPESGEFIRLITSNSATQGSRADIEIKTGRGYRQVSFARLCQPAHRMAWLHFYGEIPGGQVDHIDGDPSNNRISNLRVVNNAQNCQNRRNPTCKNKAGLLGVTKTGKQRFAAHIKKDYKSIYLGTFSTAEDAHIAYLEAKRKLHPYGEVAKLSVICAGDTPQNKECFA